MHILLPTWKGWHLERVWPAPTPPRVIGRAFPYAVACSPLTVISRSCDLVEVVTLRFPPLCLVVLRSFHHDNLILCSNIPRG